MAESKQEGSCHCGAIQYEIEIPTDKVLECNCSICRRNGYLLSFAPREKLRFVKQGPMTQYTFNKHLIQHYFCPTCGTSLFGMSKDKEGRDTVAVNVRSLKDIDLEKVQRMPYDGASK